MEECKRTIEKKNALSSELVENAKKIIDNLSPVLVKELLQYLDNNKQNIRCFTIL